MIVSIHTFDIATSIKFRAGMVDVMLQPIAYVYSESCYKFAMLCLLNIKPLPHSWEETYAPSSPGSLCYNLGESVPCMRSSTLSPLPLFMLLAFMPV